MTLAIRSRDSYCSTILSPRQRESGGAAGPAVSSPATTPSRTANRSFTMHGTQARFPSPRSRSCHHCIEGNLASKPTSPLGKLEKLDQFDLAGAIEKEKNVSTQKRHLLNAVAMTSTSGSGSIDVNFLTSALFTAN
ncbi:hypothetical protein CVT25_005111 [Psilocybe cyanescens]|uniref:Uncharacterized protein n=1 Tax=Psilocybe cyanescens TaxID=93625 RepID=A0A409XE50_PSICY|nr:hypothetical protein CVT25_005111 [Psilocybe cyanescens]